MMTKTILGAAAVIFLLSCTEKKVSTAQVKTAYCLSDTMQHMISLDSVSGQGGNDEVQLSGEVGFDENKVNKIFPRSSGHVTQCTVSLGDHVRAGQVLAVIRSADVAGNYADLNSAEADVRIAKRQMDNAESLFKSGISSEKEYTEAKQNYEKTLAAKRKIESVISINGGSGANASGTYVLTSPIDGYIVDKKINTGNFIRPDLADPLFTISNLKEVWIQANVFESDIHRVRTGLPVRVTTLAYPGKVFTGTIDNVSEVLDPQSKSMKVRIRLQNPGMLLKPQMFTKVLVTNSTKTISLTVPTQSIITDNGKSFVVVYFSRCKMEVHEIEATKEEGDRTYVAFGVQPGQQVITKNALLIYNQLINE